MASAAIILHLTVQGHVSKIDWAVVTCFSFMLAEEDLGPLNYRLAFLVLLRWLICPHLQRMLRVSARTKLSVVDAYANVVFLWCLRTSFDRLHQHLDVAHSADAAFNATLDDSHMSIPQAACSRCSTGQIQCVNPSSSHAPPLQQKPH